MTRENRQELVKARSAIGTTRTQRFPGRGSTRTTLIIAMLSVLPASELHAGTESPEAVLEAYSEAMTARDVTAYASLLAADYRFIPSVEADVSFLELDRDEEIRSTRNLFLTAAEIQIQITHGPSVPSDLVDYPPSEGYRMILAPSVNLQVETTNLVDGEPVVLIVQGQPSRFVFEPDNPTTPQLWKLVVHQDEGGSPFAEETSWSELKDRYLGLNLWYVKPDQSGDAATIAAALDSAAASGPGIVLCECGVYYEHALSVPAGISLHGQISSPPCVTIDAEYEDVVIECSDVGSASTIASLRLRNGLGAGIRAVLANMEEFSPRLDDVVIENTLGSGVLCSGSSSGTMYVGADFVRCAFEGNDGFGVSVSGIDAGSVSPSLTDCGFTANESGGLFISVNAASIALEIGSTSFITSGGHAVTVQRVEDAPSSIAIDASLVASNAGAAIATLGNHDIEVVSSTFVSNAYALSPIGTVDASFDRSIIASSTVAVTSDCIDVVASSVSCTDMVANTGGDWNDCFAAWNGVSGNFSADPIFCDPPVEDYSLSTESPCLPGNHPTGDACGQIGVLGAGCELLPDLTVSALLCDAGGGAAKTGDPIRVGAVIGNIGPAACGSSFARLEVTGCVGFSGDTQPVPGLAPGASDTLWLAPFVPVGDVCDVEAVADYLQSVTEGDEGNNIAMGSVSCAIVAAGDEPAHVPGPAVLRVPNPLRVGQRIAYGGRNVRQLEIYDVSGRRVRSWLVGEIEGEVDWDGRDDDGRLLQPGRYFVRLVGEGRIAASAPTTLLR